MAVAELGIRIESSGAEKAAANLDELSKSAGRAEAATGRVATNIIPFRRSVDSLGESSRQTAYQMRQMSFQLNDIVSGLAMGQSPFQILSQQSGQVVQILQMGPGGVGGSLRAIGATIASLITPTRLLAAGFVGIGAAVIAGGIALVNYAKNLDDLSRLSGVAATDLAKLQNIASAKGISTEDFSSGIKSFADRLNEARTGVNDLSRLFALNGKQIGDNVTSLQTVADLVRNAGNDMERLNIIQAAGFARTAENLRLFEQGGDALRRMMNSATEFGSAADKEMIQRAREFAELWASAWSDFKTSALNAITAASAGLSNLVNSATNAFLQMSGRELDPASAIRFRSGGFAEGGSLNPEIMQKYVQQYREFVGVSEKAGESTTKTTQALTEQMRVLQARISLLGESASAADKEALARLKIQQAQIEGIRLSDAEKASIIAGSTAEKARHTTREHTKIQMSEMDKLFKQLTRSSEDFAETLIEGFARGESFAQSLSNALQDLSSDLIRLGSRQVVGGLMQALSGGNAATSGFNTTGGIVGGNATGGGGLLSSISGALGLAGPLGSLAGGALAIGGGVLANLLGGNNQQQQQQQQQAMQQALQQQQEQQQRIVQSEEAAMNFRFQAATMGMDTRTQAGAMAKLEADIARERAEAAKLGGNAVVAFEELAQARRLQLEKEWAEKIESLRRDYLDREFAALNDTSTLSGKLAEYERKAAREREEAVRNGGLALVELDRAQAAERGRLLKDASKEITDYYGGLRNTISDFTRGLQFGATSTLSPAEQYLAARNDFQKQIALAQGGDRSAQGGITQVAQTLIEQARSYLGPSVEFGNLVERITQQLGDLPGIAMANDPQVQELQRLGYDYLSPINDEISGMREEQKALNSQAVQLMVQNNAQSDVIVQSLQKLGLDIRQELQSLKLRAA